MTVTNVEKNLDSLTMTISSEFNAPITRVWELWQNPRQLEKWWGPPTYPATVVEHELAAGGKVSYFMTGPEGDQHHGWWRVLSVEPPYCLEFEDGFADESGTPATGMPSMTIRVEIAEGPSGVTSMTIQTTFPSLAAMEQVTAMGMEEGMRAAMGQIDAIV